TAEIIRQMREWGLKRTPRDHKRHHATETSLANPYLQPDSKWSFVIVRTAYGPSNDELWAQFLEILRTRVEYSLQVDDELDLLPHHEITIIEDGATLCSADSYTARRAFRAWVANDLPQQLRGECLEELGGLAQILTTDWELEEEVDVPHMHISRDWEGGETDDVSEEVGWMYMETTEYVDMYDRLTGAFAWHEHYQRPHRNWIENSSQYIEWGR
ncbi:hypothetical protein COCVIDRAFT_108837, partial [Bipolaris victoriae FI3]